MAALALMILGTAILATGTGTTTSASDRNSFCGDVLLDNFIGALREEHSITDQKYEKQIF